MIHPANLYILFRTSHSLQRCNVSRALKSLGLSHYEAKALGIALRERVTPKQLSKKAGIPPGKVHSIVLSLVRKGLLEQSESRPKQVFVVNASLVIDKLIGDKQREHDALLSELRSLAVHIDASKSQASKFFDIGTTIDDNKRVQLRTFAEGQKEVCQIINIHHKPKSNRGAKVIWEQEIASAIKRGVMFRSIYPVKVVLPAILSKLPKDRFIVRRLDTDFTRCDIIDGRKTLIKLVHQDAVQYGGVLFIENERFSKNLQELFEHLWEQTAPDKRL